MNWRFTTQDARITLVSLSKGRVLSTAKMITELAINLMNSRDQQKDCWMQTKDSAFDYYRLKRLKRPYEFNEVFRTRDADNFIEA